MTGEKKREKIAGRWANVIFGVISVLFVTFFRRFRAAGLGVGALQVRFCWISRAWQSQSDYGDTAGDKHNKQQEPKQQMCDIRVMSYLTNERIKATP